MTEQREDPAKQAQQARQHKLLSELWPLRKPVRYESEQDLYARTLSTWQTFSDLPDERYFDVLSSTVLFSLRIQQFNTTPYIFLFGPKNSGKSRILDLMQILAYNPMKSSTITPAAIYQALNTWHPTLLIDETDKWGIQTKAGPSENVMAILSVLNSGYRRGDVAIRASREGGDPYLYDLFGLKMIAGTERLPETLMDRCIVLEMSHNVRDIPLDVNPKPIEELRGKLEMYYSVYQMGKAAEGNCQPVEIDVDPEELKAEIGDNRVTELFYPLYAVCPTYKGRKNLLELAKETVKERSEERESGDLARVLEAVIKTWQIAGKPQELAVKDILGEYNSDLDDAERLKARQLGWRLRKLQIPRIHTDTGAVARVQSRKLYRLARVYVPRLALELSETSETSVQA